MYSAKTTSASQTINNRHDFKLSARKRKKYPYNIVFDNKPVEAIAKMSQRQRLKPSAFVAFDKKSSEGNHE